MTEPKHCDDCGTLKRPVDVRYLLDSMHLFWHLFLSKISRGFVDVNYPVPDAFVAFLHPFAPYMHDTWNRQRISLVQWIRHGADRNKIVQAASRLLVAVARHYPAKLNAVLFEMSLDEAVLRLGYADIPASTSLSSEVAMLKGERPFLIKLQKRFCSMAGRSGSFRLDTCGKVFTVMCHRNEAGSQLITLFHFAEESSPTHAQAD